MRVLLCGEGPHDHGEPRAWDERTEGFVSLDGWLQPLLRRLRQERLEFEVRRRQDLQLLGRSRVRRTLKGHAEKASLARLIAANESFDLIVFMADTDSNNHRSWAEVVAEIQMGFGAVLEANSVAAVPCAPMSASESWLLSDAAAWRAVGLTDLSVLPARPEAIWGPRNDPHGDHPHKFFARVCEADELQDDRETRVRVMEASDPAVLATRCPVSFESFRHALTSL